MYHFGLVCAIWEISPVKRLSQKSFEIIFFTHLTSFNCITDVKQRQIIRLKINMDAGYYGAVAAVAQPGRASGC